MSTHFATWTYSHCTLVYARCIHDAFDTFMKLCSQYTTDHRNTNFFVAVDHLKSIQRLWIWRQGWVGLIYLPRNLTWHKENEVVLFWWVIFRFHVKDFGEVFVEHLDIWRKKHLMKNPQTAKSQWNYHVCWSQLLIYAKDPGVCRVHTHT